MLKNLSFGVTQESSSSQTNWVFITSGTGLDAGWSSHAITFSPSRPGKAQANREEYETARAANAALPFTMNSLRWRLVMMIASTEWRVTFLFLLPDTLGPARRGAGLVSQS